MAAAFTNPSPFPFTMCQRYGWIAIMLADKEANTVLGIAESQDRECGDVAPPRRRRALSIESKLRASLNELSYAATMSRLEDAFNLLEQARISLPTFEKIVQAEGKALARAQSSVTNFITASPYTGQNSVEGISQSIEAVEWCLNWVEQIKSQMNCARIPENDLV